jgi:hypothetical protein
MDLPTHPWLLAVYALAAGSITHTIVGNLARPDDRAARLRGTGLCLVVCAGLLLDLPGYVALASVGFLALAESALRSGRSPMTRALFEQLVRTTAATLGADSATITGPEGEETARMRSTTTAGTGVVAVAEVCLVRRSGALSHVELALGQIPPRPAAFILCDRDAGTMVPIRAPRTNAPRIPVGDEPFDARFIVRDRRSVGAALLDAATRTDLTAQLRGWLAVWPGAGLRVVSALDEDTAEAAARLTRTVVELGTRVVADRADAG